MLFVIKLGEPTALLNPKVGSVIFASAVVVTDPKLVAKPETTGRFMIAFATTVALPMLAVMLCVGNVTLARPVTVGAPRALVTANPVGVTFAFASTVAVPVAAVTLCPVTETFALPVTVSAVLSAEVITCVAGVIFASAVVVTEPIPSVDD